MTPCPRVNTSDRRHQFGIAGTVWVKGPGLGAQRSRALMYRSQQQPAAPGRSEATEDPPHILMGLVSTWEMQATSNVSHFFGIGRLLLSHQESPYPSGHFLSHRQSLNGGHSLHHALHFRPCTNHHPPGSRVTDLAWACDQVMVVFKIPEHCSGPCLGLLADGNRPAAGRGKQARQA